MKTLTKIGLFVLIVALGIFIIDNSLSGSMLDCYCSNDYEAMGECINICWDVYQVDCLDVYEYDRGCQYSDCITIWKFWCENNAKGYISTTWHNCWDCY